MDDDGIIDLLVKEGKWFDHMTMGKTHINYNSFVVLSHFKGKVSGNFVGSNKHIVIGYADGRIWKEMIFTTNQWDIGKRRNYEKNQWIK